MGIVSGSVLKHGGDVTAVVPAAMLRAGGEGEHTCDTMSPVQVNEKGREKARLFPTADEGMNDMFWTSFFSPTWRNLLSIKAESVESALPRLVSF